MHLSVSVESESDPIQPNSLIRPPRFRFALGVGLHASMRLDERRTEGASGKIKAHARARVVPFDDPLAVSDRSRGFPTLW